MENYVAQRYIENPYLIGGEMEASAQNSVGAAWLLSPLPPPVTPSFLMTLNTPPQMPEMPAFCL